MNTRIFISSLIFLSVDVAIGRESFNKEKDLLISQFDCQPEADDIHSVAALGCMLAHPDFQGVKVYGVMGATGQQTGTFINATELFDLVYGKGTKFWTDAKSNRSASVISIKDQAKAIINAGGRVWVQEAGQSDITAEWIKALVEDGVSDSAIQTQVVVVQQSWLGALNGVTNTSNANERYANPEKLEFVKNKTIYTRLFDGARAGNGTPCYSSDAPSFFNEALTGNSNTRSSNINTSASTIWELAEKVISSSGFKSSTSSIDEGGVKFADCVDLWWIFEVGEKADTVRKFWDCYVVNETSRPSTAVLSNIPSPSAKKNTNVIVAPNHQSDIPKVEFKVGNQIPAVNYSGESHPKNDSKIFRVGDDVGYIKGGTWIAYTNFNFAQGASSFTVEMSCDKPKGGNLRLRLGSPSGEEIGSIEPKSTESFDNYIEYTISIKSVKGIHDLYLVADDVLLTQSYLYNLRSWKFSK